MQWSLYLIGIRKSGLDNKAIELLIKEEMPSINEDSTAFSLLTGIHWNLSKCYQRGLLDLL